MASNLTTSDVTYNLKSIIWNYFRIRTDDTGRAIDGCERKPTCRTCSKQVPCKDENTTNMFAHLRDVQPLLYKKAMKTNEATTRPSFSTHRDQSNLLFKVLLSMVSIMIQRVYRLNNSTMLLHTSLLRICNLITL